MKQFRSVTLRQVLHSDLPMLFSLLSDPDRFHLWGHRRVLDESQFAETWRYWSSERMDARFIIVRNNRPVGLVFDYERCLEDGHTKVATILDESATGMGTGIVATGLLIDWLFQNVALRKAYLDVFGFNTSVIRMLRKLEVPEEMRRAEHRFWNGRYWDWHGFAMTRTDFPRLARKLLREPSRSLLDTAESAPGRVNKRRSKSIDMAMCSLVESGALQSI